MDDVENLLGQALEWRRLSQMTEVAEVRAECADRQIEALKKLLSRRFESHRSRFQNDPEDSLFAAG